MNIIFIIYILSLFILFSSSIVLSKSKNNIGNITILHASLFVLVFYLTKDIVLQYSENVDIINITNESPADFIENIADEPPTDFIENMADEYTLEIKGLDKYLTSQTSKIKSRSLNGEPIDVSRASTTAVSGTSKTLGMKSDKGKMLQTGKYLATGEYLVSDNKLFFVIMQSDGNLVVYNGSGPSDNKGSTWLSETEGKGESFAIMQSDGNFVVYKGSGPSNDSMFDVSTWSSQTGGKGESFAIMQDDGNFVVYKGSGPTDNKGATWSSKGGKITTTPITDANIQTAVNAWCEPNTKSATEVTYGHIKDWDTSGITTMLLLFHNKSTFNDDISGWDVSKVTNMQSMFWNAKAFNQPIGNWNVSKVTNMNGMFTYDPVFNQPIGNWNVSNVTDMINMFLGVKAFNQPIGKWDVSKVTNMENMFLYAKAFNQPIGNWNVSNVTVMVNMFNSATSFNQPISNWDVSKVTTMENMFNTATSFNQPIGNWNVSKVTNFYGMFAGATAMVKHQGASVTPTKSYFIFKDVVVNDTVVCTKNDPLGYGAGAAYRYGGDNMIQYYPTPPIAATWNKDWDKNIITIPDCSEAILGTPKVLGRAPYL
jgi:surface protein